MAKQAASNLQTANLTPDQMRTAITKLERRINELKELDIKQFQSGDDLGLLALQTSIEDTLQNVFGVGTIEYNRYINASRLDMNNYLGMFFNGHGPGVAEIQAGITEGKKRAVALLEQAVRSLKEHLEDLGETKSGRTMVVTSGALAKALSRQVFIVHGHDDGVREAVARFLEKIDFEPIILHEQANKGLKTVIEKVETYSGVGFAIILLTPDDTGCKVGDTPKPRPRQNVLLELGYFIARLGRAKVCAFATTSDLDIPTDFAGVIWEPFEKSGGWKATLGRELEAAGFNIDWNKAMKP